MHRAITEIMQRLPAGEFYVSFPFWGYFAVAVLVFRMTPFKNASREWLLLVCNICMLMALPRFTLTMFVVLVGMCVVTYGCACQLLSSAESANRRGRTVVAVLGIAVILSTLVFFKYGVIQDVVLRAHSGSGPVAVRVVFLIGISYSSFKAMHFIIEAYQVGLKDPTFLKFLNYILFFPSFISGPINRYNHFCENSAAARNSTLRADLASGLSRVIDGLFKKLVLAAIFLPYTVTNTGIPIQEMAVWQIMLGLYAYALYFYFDFSGYTDLAIGGARLMGFVLPENFNLPFLKRNIQQLWANWHISLTSWLTDYVYWPLVRRLRNAEFFRRHPILLSNVAIIVTFAACGIWHGDTLSFLLWGLYHGLGIAVVNTYQNWKRKVRHPMAREYFQSTYSRWTGVVMTFNFFAVGQLLFVLDFQQIRNVFGHLI